jgi:hypothetical protein
VIILPGIIREFRGLFDLPRRKSRSELLDFSRSGDFLGLFVGLVFELRSKCSDLDFGMAAHNNLGYSMRKIKRAYPTERKYKAALIWGMPAIESGCSTSTMYRIKPKWPFASKICFLSRISCINGI